MTANFKPNVLKKRYTLRLFVAGNATNSRIARENLEQLLARHPKTCRQSSMQLMRSSRRGRLRWRSRHSRRSWPW